MEIIATNGRTFRPSTLTQEMSAYELVNVGAAGTFIVRRPGPCGKFRSELLRKVPFEARLALCKGSDILRLESENPFGRKPSLPATVQFVSILPKPSAIQVSLPIQFLTAGEWLVRVVGVEGQFVFGTYRRHMRSVLTTDRYLACNQNLEKPIDERFGCLFDRSRTVELRYALLEGNS